MKRIKTIILLSVALLLIPVVVFASPAIISDAEYLGIVRITNNSTASTGVSVPCSIFTQALIDAGYITSNCTNTATLTPAGADTAYMPARSGDSSWMFWLPSIANLNVLDYRLYAGGATDMAGMLRYFPGVGGMASLDSSSLEPSANFTFEQSGWVDTSYSANKTLIYKEDAFKTYISATGAITSKITPAGTTDIAQLLFDDEVELQTAQETRAGQRYNSFPAAEITSVSFYMRKFNVPTGTAYIRIRAVSDDSIIGTIATLDVSTLTDSSGWEDFDTTPVTVPTSQDIRILLEFDGGGGSNELRQSYKQAAVTTGLHTKYDPPNWTDTAGHDLTFKLSYRGLVEVTASGVSSGDYLVTTTANVTHMWIDIDGDTKDTVALNGENVTDNSANWTYYENMGAYWEYTDISVNGTQVQYIEWQNTSGNFTDPSGFGNDAEPTYRTTSSDADISAELISFKPIAESEAEGWDVTVAKTMIGTPTAGVSGEGPIPEMFTENVTAHLPGAGFFNAMIVAGGVSWALFWIPFCYILVIVIGVLTFGATRSLGMQTAIMAFGIAFFATLGPVPFVGVIIFVIDSVAVIMMSKQIGW